MANSDIIKTIKNAEIDARSLSGFVYLPASKMVERRLAPKIHTLQYYLDYLDSIPAIVSKAIDETTIEGAIVTDSMVAVAGATTQARLNSGFNSKEHLSSITAPIDGTKVHIIPDSYSPMSGGTFIWDSSDLSPSVADDPYKGIYIPLDGTDGSNGAFVRRKEGDVASALWWGIESNTDIDQTEVFQSALNAAQKAGYKEFRLDGTGELWISCPNDPSTKSTSVIIPEGLTLDLNKREIKLKPNDLREYRMLSVSDNVTVKNGIVTGDLFTHIDTGGEWGKCIQVHQVENVVLEDLLLRECWGDGITISASGIESEFKNNKNIVLRNIKSVHNRRQGMSVISVDGLRTYDCEFSNTGLDGERGTWPKTGVDFEPDKGYQTLTNIRMYNTICKNNRGYGITFLLDRMRDSNLDIEVHDYYSQLDFFGAIRFGDVDPSVGGTIKIVNATLSRGVVGGCLIEENWGRSVRVYLQNITGINTGVNDPTDIARGQVIGLLGDSSKIGNLYIDNVRYLKTVAAAKAKHVIYAENAQDLVGVSIRNVNWGQCNLAKIDVNKNDVDPSINTYTQQYQYTGAGKISFYDIHMSYIRRASVSDGSFYVMLPDISSTTSEFEFINQGVNNNAASNHKYIEAPAGQVIAPFGTRKAGFRSETLPTHGGQSLRFKCIGGQWTVVSWSSTVAPEGWE